LFYQLNLILLTLPSYFFQSRRILLEVSLYGRGSIIKQTIAIYPGSFDPLTNGHLDLISRASKIFDKVVVGVTDNSQKSQMFSSEQRMRLVGLAIENAKGIDNVVVTIFNGLLIDFVNESNGNVILRGLRAVSDFDYEFAMALMNRHLDESIDTIFLPASEGNSFVSSSMVKEVFSLGGDVSDKVPSCVVKALTENEKNKV